MSCFDTRVRGLPEQIPLAHPWRLLPLLLLAFLRR